MISGVASVTEPWEAQPLPSRQVLAADITLADPSGQATLGLHPSSVKHRVNPLASCLQNSLCPPKKLYHMLLF